MGKPADKTHMTCYVPGVRTSAWRAFRAETLRLGLSRSEALEAAISAWLKEKAE